MQWSCRLRCRCFAANSLPCSPARQVVEERITLHGPCSVRHSNNWYHDDRSQCSISGQYTVSFSFILLVSIVCNLLLLGPFIQSFLKYYLSPVSGHGRVSIPGGTLLRSVGRIFGFVRFDISGMLLTCGLRLVCAALLWNNLSAINSHNSNTLYTAFFSRSVSRCCKFVTSSQTMASHAGQLSFISAITCALHNGCPIFAFRHIRP